MWSFIWLVLISLVGSLVSVAYYFKPVIAMYLREGDDTKLESTAFFRASLLVIALLILFVALFPFLFMRLIL